MKTRQIKPGVYKRKSGPGRRRVYKVRVINPEVWLQDHNGFVAKLVVYRELNKLSNIEQAMSHSNFVAEFEWVGRLRVYTSVVECAAAGGK